MKTATTKTKTAQPKSESRNKTSRAKLALVERCHSLGLLELHSVERLEKLAETIRAHVGAEKNIKSAVRRVSTKRIFTIVVGAGSRPI